MKDHCSVRLPIPRLIRSLNGSFRMSRARDIGPWKSLGEDGMSSRGQTCFVPLKSVGTNKQQRQANLCDGRVKPVRNDEVVYR